MTRRPWYKRDGAAFIAKTMGLSLEEKGAYSLCLDLIYANGAPIADDPRYLAGICGVSLRKWASLRESLLRAGKLVASNGVLMNPRAIREIEALEASHQDAVENGSTGGRKRAENAAKPHRNTNETPAKPHRNDDENSVGASNNNNLHQATLNQERERVDIEEEEEEGSTAADAAAPALLPALVEAEIVSRETPASDSLEIPAFLLRTSTTPRPSAEVVPLDPLDRALEAYHRTVDVVNGQGASWAKCVMFSQQRRAATRKRLDECGGIEGWCALMARAAQSSFLLGRTGRSSGHENWKVGLDFFLQPKTFNKLREGSYDDAPGNAATGPSALDAGFARAAAAYSD